MPSSVEASGNGRRINWNLLILFFIFIIIAIILATNPGIYVWFSEVMREVFTAEIPIALFYGTPVILSVLYYFRAIDVGDEILFTGSIHPFVDVFFTGWTYGYLVNTSFFVLGRVFIQVNFGETYFVGFSQQELLLISVLMSSIMYWSILQIYQMAQEVFVGKQIARVSP